MGLLQNLKILKGIFVQSERSLPSVQRHFWLLPDDFSKEKKETLDKGEINNETNFERSRQTNFGLPG